MKGCLDLRKNWGDKMKTCPRCGSVLADNEPYCENCGFDPDYDSEEWDE